MNDSDRSDKATLHFLIDTTSRALIPVCHRFLDTTLCHVAAVCSDPCTCRQKCFHGSVGTTTGDGRAGKCPNCKRPPRPSCGPCVSRHDSLRALHVKNKLSLHDSDATQWLNIPLEVLRLFVSPAVSSFDSIERADASIVFGFLSFNKKVPEPVRRTADKARDLRNKVAHMFADENNIGRMSAGTLCGHLEQLLLSVAAVETSFADMMIETRDKLRKTVATAAALVDPLASSHRSRGFGADIDARRMRQQQYVDAVQHSLIQLQNDRLGPDRVLMRLQFVDVSNASHVDHTEVRADVTQALVQRAQTKSVGVLLLSGDAGSGKSACVRAVAEQLIQKERVGPFSSHQNQSGTFFVDLSKLTGRMPVSSTINSNADALSEALLRLIVTHLANFMALHRPRDRHFEELFRQQIRHGRCVFLLDSFDEMSAILSGEESTQQLHSLSTALEALGLKHLVIVASRRFHRPQCQTTWELELKGPCEEDQRAFVNSKLLAVSSLELPLKEAVVEALFENERLCEMRERPLLLSLTCDFIARQSGYWGCTTVAGLLPQSPHGIFSDWCKMTLTRRDYEGELDLEQLLLIAYTCGMVAQTSGQQSWALSDLESRVRERLVSRQCDSAALMVPLALKTLEDCGILLRATTLVDNTAGAASAVDDAIVTQKEHRVCFWHRRLLEWFAAEHILELTTDELPTDLLDNDAWEHVVALLLNRCAHSSGCREHEELLRWFLNQATLRCSTLIREHGEEKVADASDEELCRQLEHVLGSEPCDCERREGEDVPVSLFSWRQRLYSMTTTCFWRFCASVARWFTLRPHVELLPVHNAYNDDEEYGVAGGPVDELKNDGVDESARARWMESCNYILYVFSGVARNGIPVHACGDFARFQRAALELAVCASRHGDWRCVDMLLNSTGVLSTPATNIVLAAALENQFFYERAIVKVAQWEMLQYPTFVAAVQFKIAECVASPNPIASRPLLWIFLMRTKWYRLLCEKQERERARCDNEVKRLQSWISVADPEKVSPRIQEASNFMERVRGSKWHYGIVVSLGFAVFVMSCLYFNVLLTPYFLFPLLIAGSRHAIFFAAFLNLLVWFLFLSPFLLTFVFEHFFDMSSVCGGRESLEWVRNTDTSGCYMAPNAGALSLSGLWVSYDTSCQNIQNNTMVFQCCMDRYSCQLELNDVHSIVASSLNATVFCGAAGSLTGTGVLDLYLDALLLLLTIVLAFWYEFIRVLIRSPFPRLMNGKVLFFLSPFLGFVAAICSLSSSPRKIQSRHVDHVRFPIIILCTLCCVAVIAGSMLVAQCVLVFGLPVITKPLAGVLGASAAVGAIAMLVITVAPLATLDRSFFKTGGVFLRALWHTQRRWLLFVVLAAIAALSYGGFRWLSGSVSSLLDVPIVQAALARFAIACALLGSVVMLGIGALLGWIASCCSKRRKESMFYRGSLAHLGQALRCPFLEDAEREVSAFLSRDGGALCLTGKDIALVRQWTVQYRGRSEAIEFGLFSLQQKVYRASLL